MGVKDHSSFSLSSALTTGIEIYAVISLSRYASLLSSQHLRLSASAHHLSKAPPDGSVVTKPTHVYVVKSTVCRLFVVCC